MPLDEPFPLVAVPSWVRHAILNEFKGRCPSIREVAEISDRQWLKTPDIGPAALKMIRSVTDERQRQTARLSDGELLKRLEWLQKELRWLERQLKSRLPKMATGDETGHQRTSQPLDNHAQDPNSPPQSHKS
jgi:hypothetical protein